MATKGRSAAGGKAEAAGSGYETLVVAWYCVRIFLGRLAQPLFDLPADSRLVGLRSQADEEVDDVSVFTSDNGVLFINVKRSVGLTTGGGSPLAKALDQFVGQYKSASDHTSDAIRGRGLDPARDRLVLATRTTAPGKIKGALFRLLRGLRDQPDKNLLSQITLNAEEIEVAGVFETHLHRSWQAAYGAAPTAADLGPLLRLIHLQFIDVEVGEADRLRAMDDLRAQILTDPTQADAAFSHLVAHCTRLRADQSGADISTLLTTLAQAGVHLQAAPDYRPDIAALRAWTTRRLAIASRFTHLIDGDPASVINRAAWPALTQATKDNSVLLVGDPGAGKSGLAYRLAQSELALGRDVIFIPVDMLTVETLAGLRAELEITHDFAEILENWPGGAPGLLVVDALDAARKSETQTALRVTIEDVLNRAGGRWKVVASVRTYDLRQGTEWGRMFRGRPPAPDHADPSFRIVRHIAVARLTDDELAHMPGFSPTLSALFTAAHPQLRSLLRNIFNFRLLAQLVGDGIVTSELAAIATQAELLDTYWTHRVRRSDGGHDRREQALRAVVDQMLVTRSLQADRAAVVAQADPAAIVDLEQHDLIRAEDEHGRNEHTLLFTHHVLFDYAVARLVFRRGRNPANLVDRLATEPALTLMLRPSLSLAFSEVWGESQADRPRFWNLAFALAAESRVPAVGQLIGPMTIAEHAEVIGDLQPLLDALRSGDPRQAAAELILQHLTGAILARAKAGAQLVGPKAGPWMALVESLAAIRTDTAMMAMRVLIQFGTERPAELTPDQLLSAGAAARGLLDFAWARSPRIEQLIVTGINAAANTIGSDPAATVTLLRRALEPEHLRQFGYEELDWVTRHIRGYSAHDLTFVVDLYAAIFGHEERSSDEKTNISASAIMGLTSTRRQDYEMAWWALGEAVPRLLDEHPAAGTRAVARGLAGYVDRHETDPESPVVPEQFDLNGRSTPYLRDRSYGWNSRNTRHHRDAPTLINKFDEFLERVAVRHDGPAVFGEVVATVADERGDAVLWASLLQAAANHPDLFAAAVLPLARAAPILGSLETRFQVGNLLSAAFSQLNREDRADIETAILSLSQPGRASTTQVLAGCLAAADCVTDEMQAFKAEMAADAQVPANRPAMEFTSTSRVYDTDTYLKDMGVSLDDARQRLNAIDPLVDRLLGLAQGQIDSRLFEHATGVAAEAAHRIAVASYEIIGQPDVRDRLKRVFLFAKGSTFPAFTQEHEDNFHANASWGSPSARNGSAGGLMALARPQNPLDGAIRDAVRELAQDPVCDVRMQVVQSLHFLRNSDPEWMWAEVERVVQNEYTRCVVDSAIQTLAQIAYLDIPRAIRIAKLALTRYEGQDGPGTGQVCLSAASLIMDIHFIFPDSEADQFYASRLADPSSYADSLHMWVSRYSDSLTKGDDTGSKDDELRARTIAFYRECATAVSDEAAKFYTQHDLAKSQDWPPEVLAQVQALNGVLDDVALRIYFAGGGDNKAELSRADMARQWRLYRELLPVLDRLAECSVVHTAYYFVQALENFIPADPAGMFRLIAKSVMSSAKFGYQFEAMGADVVVRIVETYLADHREIFSNEARLNELMDLLNLFVSAGWPAAQSLTFRLAEIWR